MGVLKSNSKMTGIVLSLVATLGMGIYIKMLQNDRDELEGRAILYISQLDQAAEVNANNAGTITKLRLANKSLADAIRITDEVRNAAAAAAVIRAAEANARTANALDELEELRNANPTCEQVSNIDLGAACPLVVERLRRSADEAASQD